MPNNPQFLVIHCTASPDSGTMDWEAVRKVHTDPKPRGNGWSDIGYHFGVEKIGDRYEILRGRSPKVVGAHCKAAGMNRKSLGICMVGGDPYDGFGDKYLLPEEQRDLTIDLCADLCMEYDISPENVVGHREFDPGKTCPGTGVDMDDFREDVAERIAEKKAGYLPEKSKAEQIKILSEKIMAQTQRLQALAKGL